MKPLSRRAVVQAVLDGRSLRTFAGGEGIALETARKQLRPALGRLGLSSQKLLFRAFERFEANMS
ncbi:hypothetical protein LXM94_00940 [Rhizobium sp. TRM95111]|uniref:hypothetical protein n=1 Tax=Rhizobium alarense TaxID=2846851 RepID=UPI001F48AFEA|nr:hypothetical protein [Rhizobium alarense]MCF3638533.1 hypothetical protein [Rhizobium alarense]